MNKTEWKIVKEVLVALIKEREFLGYLLSHERGLVSKEDYEDILEEFLWTPQNVPNLETKVEMLFELIGEHQDVLDAELVSTIFHCNLADANQALFNVTKKILDRVLA
jgi:hypothetical protein